MKSMIIGFAGAAGAGKSTAARYLSRRYDLVRLSFAEPLRDAMARMNPIVGKEAPHHDGRFLHYNDVVTRLGYDQAKAEYPEIRRLLQKMGTEVGRDILGRDIWVEALRRTLEPGVSYVIDDIRFPNELNFLTTLRTHTTTAAWIHRWDAGPTDTTHPSEHSLSPRDFYQLGGVIFNEPGPDSRFPLEPQVDKLYRSLVS